jgi:putative flippase GtrA
VRLPQSQFLRFCLVGVVGFVADAGILQVLLANTRAGLYLGRVVSFLIAATLTWALNRWFTFDAVRGSLVSSGRQWRRYVALTALGAAINYGVYAACLAEFALTRKIPALAVAAGSVVALAFNYLAAKYLVFRSG